MHPIDKVLINFNPDQLFVLNICLAFLMFSVALDIRAEDFKRVFQQPKAVAIGLTSQLLFLPLITLGLVFLFDLPPSIHLGMLLVAACPGGNVSNFAVYLAKGNAALSVTMTSIVTLAAIVLTPLLFTFWSSFVPNSEALRQTIYVEPWAMVKIITLLIAFPLALGMLCNYYLPKLTSKILKPSKILSMLMFLAFVVFAFIGNYEHFINYVDNVFWVVLVHNGLALTSGYFFAKVMGLAEKDRRAISIETGIQNSGLGLILIFNFFNGLGGMAIITAWWGIWHLVAGFGMAMFWGQKDRF